MNKSITKKNIIRKQTPNKYQKEYIGKTITITKTNNKQQQGITGTITNETKNTFEIKVDVQNTEPRTLKITKQDKTFKIENDEIQGNKITKKPEERIKIKG